MSYPKLAAKLLGPRSLTGIRYYIGLVKQQGNSELYAAQRKFVDALRASDPRISVHFGRLEPRPAPNPVAKELRQLLSTLPVRLDPVVYRALSDLASRNANPTVFVEKAVDVMLAVDMVVMAERNEFDSAYLLSADGDFTPAVEAVRRHGKRVYAVSAGSGAQLARAVNSFIRVDSKWLSDCFL
ncbi:MAG: NYN domain-containing protein [Gemmatimonadales bacterium]|nr:NYN domain-containing protein [Gemmatimonadales bacterium]